MGVVFCLSVCLCTMHRSSALGGQKWVSDALGNGVTDGNELPCRCWGSNAGLLEKQSVLLTSEPSHQPQLLSGFHESKNRHSPVYRWYLLKCMHLYKHRIPFWSDIFEPNIPILSDTKHQPFQGSSTERPLGWQRKNELG